MNDRTDQTALAVGTALKGNVVDYLFENSLGPENAARTYLRCAGRDHTFADLYRRVCQAGHWLKSLGVQPGDRVMFSVRDGIEFPSLFLGAIKIGAVALPINTFLQPADYAYYIKDSGAKVVIVDHSLVDAIERIRSTIELPQHLYVLGGEAEGFESFEPAWQIMPTELDTFPMNSSDVCFWLYSSGSTGEPKGVVHTHGHLYWATELFGLGTAGLTSADVIQCPPKMFFAFGLGFQIYFPVRVAAMVLCDSGPIKPAPVTERLVRERPTVFIGVPTLYASVLEKLRAMDAPARRAGCERLRLCISGGEVLPAVLHHDWREATGAEILDGVGTTEMTHMFLLNRPGQAVAGSCGRLVDGYTARLLDDEGRDVPEGEVGNLFVSGPTAALAYWNKPERTARTMFNGGVLTGDKCRRDAEGNYFYVGRVDDMLRVGGIWVSPAEVESCLAEHPAVLESAVVGAADEHDLIKPKAFLVLREGCQDHQALVDSIREHVRARLAHIKCPRWIEVVPDLPKTATGKIQRFRLRQAQIREDTVA